MSTGAEARALALCTPAARRGAKVAPAGYVDLLGAADPIGAHPGQQLMASRALPMIYERIWRPGLGRVLMGVFGPSMADEHRMAEQMLTCSAASACSTSPADRRLHAALRRAVGEAGARGRDRRVGDDARARDAQRRRGPNVAFVRGDAWSCRSARARFDAVCCFAALYLIDEPMRRSTSSSACSRPAAGSR